MFMILQSEVNLDNLDDMEQHSNIQNSIAAENTTSG